MATQLKEVGDQEETAGACGGQAAFEQGGDVMLDAMAGDDNFAGFAGAVEDLDLLLGQEARREGLGRQRFFLHRP